MPHLAILIVSTRPGRKGGAIGAWVEQVARRHATFDIDLVDLAEVNLPLFDEPEHPRLQRYQGAHTMAWSSRIAKADAFVFVTPEYNYSAPPSLINALDYLSLEWAYKPVAFVSYGGAAGGTRAVQMIKLTVTALKMVPLVEGVTLPFFTKFLDAATGVFAPDEAQQTAARTMLDELGRWTSALAALRPPA
jgi:NAD(P)H-dependent FMN reductase